MLTPSPNCATTVHLQLFQLCDVRVPALQLILAACDTRDICHESDGWLADGVRSPGCVGLVFSGQP